VTGSGSGRTSIAETRHGRFRAVALENDRLRVVAVPEVGGKVVSLVDRSSGREWLYQPARAPVRPEPDEAFTAENAYGWDECFPGVSAGTYPADPWRGERLPDHGELWSRAWSLEVEGKSVVTAAEGARFPYGFRRSLRLDGARLLVDYAVENRSRFPFPFVWLAHPLLATEPGMRLEVAGSPQFRVDSSTGARLPAADEQVAWPPTVAGDGDPLDLSIAPDSDVGLALKLYSERLQVGAAAIVATDGWLGLRFDPAAVPFLGVWLDYGGWPTPGQGLYHVALEPSTGDADALEVALDRRSYSVLPANGGLAWQLELTLGSDEEALHALLRP
jgi:galactose mutarotase-like enzyme